MTEREVVLVDGVRTPFLRSGTAFADLDNYQLARIAISALIGKTGIAPEAIGSVIYGNVIANTRNPNVARDGMLGAGLDPSTPAFSVSQACISANRAAAISADMIRTGQIDVAIAGGVECLSDAPIGHSKAFRKRLQALQKAKGVGGMFKVFKGFKFKELKPDVPAIAEFSTGLTMGQDCDRLAARFGVSRDEQDAFAERSHKLAAKAWEDGLLSDEVCRAQLPPKFEDIDRDNGFRGDTSLDKLAALRPAFVKPHGTVTAGNASFLTDGAANVLLMSRSKAEELGYDSSVVLRHYVFSGQNPDGELLLGPAYSSAACLSQTGMKLEEIDVFEFHEAFAGQVLANLKCMESKTDSKDLLGLESALGTVPMDRLNTLGGSLSLGHPFGATGVRLLNTARNRLIRENGRYALIAACAAGGMGSAMLLERRTV